MRRQPCQTTLRTVLPVTIIAVAALLPWPARADDFRVATQVFQGTGEQPISTNMTRFRGSVVWDFTGDGSEIVMFDKSRGRFAILDIHRKLRTELTTDAVLLFTQQLRDWAAAQNDPLLKFCAAPRLDRTAGAEPGTLAFTGRLLTYQVTTEKAPKPQMATDYREFSDWYARLNVIFQPGSLPPFARLIVNEQLGREKLIPREVRLTVPPQRRFGNAELVVRSTHDYREGLAHSDLAEIETASRYLVTFQNVPLGTYRQQDQRTAQGARGGPAR